MPSTARLGSMVVDTDSLEAILPTPEELAAMPVKTPYPLLRKTGRRATMELRTAVLENEWLQVTFALDLGGRMIGLLDKRTNTWILEIPTELHLEEGGVRGVRLNMGLELLVGQGERLNALGPVEHMLIEPSEEDESAAVILHELIPGLGVSWHARWSLPEGAAMLELEFRALNRGLYSDQAVEFGLCCATIPQLLCASETELSFFGPSQSGIALSSERVAFEEAREDSKCFVRRTQLFPRHTDSFEVKLYPYSGFDQPAFAVAGGCLAQGNSKATFQFSNDFDEFDFCQEATDGGELSLPVPASASKGSPFTVELRPFMDFLGLRRGDSLGLIQSRELWKQGEALLEEHELKAERDYRSGSHRGASRLQEILLFEPSERGYVAVEKCEEALLWIGDDHLTWWQIAALKRNRDGVEDDCPELLNAHFLAPMEPMLRAEAFLAMRALQSKDPNPILGPLAANPEAALEVVTLLFDAGLTQDMARLADELLRHREHALIRYLLAFACHMRGMPAECAMHLQKAESLPLESPLPWRWEFRSIFGVLGNKYPDFPKLSQMFAYISCWYPDAPHG